MKPNHLHSARPLAALLILLAFLGIAGSAGAQEIDSTWDDLGLDPEGFKYDEDVIGQVSSGWFPQPYTGYTLSYTGPLFYSDVFDRASNLRSHSLRPTTEPFTWHNPYDDDEREIYQPYKDEEEDDGYPATGYDEYLLTFLWNLRMPVILRASAGLQVTEGMLFSSDTSRSYLTLRGVAQPFKEVGVVYLKQHSIVGSAGINIPIYGGFIKSEAITLSSYYYIYAGYSAAYAVSSKGTQYTQIANAKDDIRYGNGADTVTLINNARLPDLNRLRTSLDFALGWNVAAEFGALGFEVFASVPQSSVLKDADWKQYFVGLRASIGWHWQPTKRDTTGIPPP